MVLTEIRKFNYLGEETEIIDAKRSVYSVRNKDLVIYPQYANKVTFWCLYGEQDSFMEEESETEIEFKSCESLIKELQEKAIDTNRDLINQLITKIQDLKGKKIVVPTIQSKSLLDYLKP